MTEFSMFMSIQRQLTRNNLPAGVSSKDYKVIWKIKRENKVLIEEFNCTMDKTERYVENEV